MLYELNTIDKLEKILVSPRLRESSKSFVESLLAQAKNRDLSEKQITYVDKFWDECYPPQEMVDAEESWNNSFTPEMKENLKITGMYYEYHYPNSRIAKFYKDPNWIPSKDIYEKSCESQWAKTTIKNYKTPFRFSVGDLVVLRDTQKNRSSFAKEYRENPILILEQMKPVSTNFVNYYKVICTSLMEEQKIVEIKEADLNVIKNKKGQNG